MNEYSQLIKAIKHEDQQTLEHLLKVKNVNPNCWTKSGFPLQVAASSNSKTSTGTLTLLLDAGASPNTPDGSVSPLQRSILSKNFPNVKLLVKRGARVNHRDGNKSTPLHTSVFYQDPYISKFLIDAKANLEAEDEYGWTPFHELISMTPATIDFCNMFIDAGADLNHRDASGSTLLHLAVQKGKIDVVVLLLEKGANPQAATGNGDTALHLACHFGKLDMLELLIKVGICIESHNNQKFTPLHTAVYHKHIPAVFYLIKAGANVNTVNITGRRPIYIAGPRQDLECLNLLLTAGSRVSQELCEVECLKSPITVMHPSNPLSVIMKNLSCNPQSLTDICILTIRKMLAPQLQVKAYLLPVPDSFQHKIALQSLVLDNISDYSNLMS